MVSWLNAEFKATLTDEQKMILATFVVFRNVANLILDLKNLEPRSGQNVCFNRNPPAWPTDFQLINFGIVAQANVNSL